MLREKRITNLPYHSFTRVSTSTSTQHNAQPITPETPHNIFAIISIQWKMRSGTDRSTKRNDVILCGLLAQTECAVNIRMLTMCFAFSCNRDFPENLESGHTTHPTSVCQCVWVSRAFSSVCMHCSSVVVVAAAVLLLATISPYAVCLPVRATNNIDDPFTSTHFIPSHLISFRFGDAVRVVQQHQ